MGRYHSWVLLEESECMCLHCGLLKRKAFRSEAHRAVCEVSTDGGKHWSWLKRMQATPQCNKTRSKG